MGAADYNQILVTPPEVMPAAAPSRWETMRQDQRGSMALWLGKRANLFAGVVAVGAGITVLSRVLNPVSVTPEMEVSDFDAALTGVTVNFAQTCPLDFTAHAKQTAMYDYEAKAGPVHIKVPGLSWKSKMDAAVGAKACLQPDQFEAPVIKGGKVYVGFKDNAAFQVTTYTVDPTAQNFTHDDGPATDVAKAQESFMDIFDKLIPDNILDTDKVNSLDEGLDNINLAIAYDKVGRLCGARALQVAAPELQDQMEQTAYLAAKAWAQANHQALQFDRQDFIAKLPASPLLTTNYTPVAAKITSNKAVTVTDNDSVQSCTAAKNLPIEVVQP